MIENNDQYNSIAVRTWSLMFRAFNSRLVKTSNGENTPVNTPLTLPS